MRHSIDCVCGFETPLVEEIEDIDFGSLHAHQEFCSQETPAVHKIVMPEERDELHIMVDNIEVVVKRTDEGVVVDLSSDKENPNEELIASTYAFFHE
jgi:hypothetical protein